MKDRILNCDAPNFRALSYAIFDVLKKPQANIRQHSEDVPITIALYGRFNRINLIGPLTLVPTVSRGAIL